MAFFLDNYITRNYLYENNIFEEKKRFDKISNIIIVILPESAWQTFFRQPTRIIQPFSQLVLDCVDILVYNGR